MALTDDGDLDPFMSVPKVAALFDVTTETIRNWINADKIEAVKVNGYWRIARSEVIRFGKSKYGNG